MLSRYRELSGFMPAKESDIMLRMQTLAGEIYKERAHAEYILRQMFPTTAEGEYLDAHAAQRGITRKTGQKAKGTVIFVSGAEIQDAILIPAGTVVCTTGDLLRFVTDSDVLLPGNAGFIHAHVTAAEIGKAYNVAENTVGIVVTSVLGVDRVYNAAAFGGGADRETDDELRARIADSYANISNGTNAAYYRSIAMGVEGVCSATAVGRLRGEGTVDVYAMGESDYLPVNTYREIQDRLQAARELNVDVLVHRPTAVNINLYIRLKVQDGYRFADVSAAVKSAVEDYLNRLGIGEDVLLSNVGEVIHHIKGVSDYRFSESYGSDVTLDDTEKAVANNILVGET